ncbi:hypothetical protein ABES02_29570 [Neobacillus pocheonensis]|uniref:hypothetical protein n=1 Tax=Neobacillus pocheonensis TaxID=363869 RepID=UPI003D2AACC9
MRQEGRGGKTKNGTDRSKRTNAVLPKLTDDSIFKLKRLALACGQFHTHLAEDILEMALNHPDIINYFQDKYKAKERILPVRKDGNVEYC